MKSLSIRRVWIPVALSFCLFTGLQAQRIVYPQAAVGPAGDGAFEIQLRLGNASLDDPWNGSIRLLRQSDLEAVTGLTYRDESGAAISSPSGVVTVQIPPGQARMYRITSSTLHIGVLLIESTGSPIEELAASFYYFLLGSSGKVADVIAVQGQTAAHGSYRVMISSLPTFDVGVAVVAAKSLPTSGVPSTNAGVTPVEMTAFLKDGSSMGGSVSLGGADDFQKALFPYAVIPHLPRNTPIAQLKIESPDDIYVTTLAVGSPPDFEDIQIGAAPAGLDPSVPYTGLQVDTQNRDAVVAFYNRYYRASDGVAPDWTGNVSSCTPGTVTAAFNRSLLRRINYFRAMARVPADVVFSDELNGKCQQAALMMLANRQSSHTPPPSWTCYQEDGAEAAGKSNLYYLTGGTPTPSDIIDGYVKDPGAGNTAVGHRRWILFPRQRTMGAGTASQGPAANALWVIGDFAPGPQLRSAWPPEGYVPNHLIFERWSFSFPGADFGNTTVEMTQAGQPVTLTVEQVVDGFGDNTIVWVPNVLSETPSSDVTFQVRLRNVSINGILQDFDYQVTAINVSP